MSKAIPKIPRATYRFQFHRRFRLGDAIGLIPYLEKLGVSHVYASPLFQARPESTHGYDVCDPAVLNSEIGSEEELRKFSEELRSRGMGLLLDIVPNHMGTDLSNRWWRDVLEKGQHSAYGGFFDIAWDAMGEPWKGKVLVPVLGDRYDKVLAKGELKLGFKEGRFHVAYYGKEFPVSPESQEKLNREMGATSAEGVKSFLAKYDASGGGAEGVARLDQLLRQQHYRLAYWRVGPEQLNYRRFFDITDLIAVKVESPKVFDETHHYLFRLMKKGIVSGVRVDHPDGLWNPKTYFERLQEKGREATEEREPVYLLVEKILSEEECLPEDWPVAGTTGYDYLNYANGLSVDRRNEGRFRSIYEEFTGRTQPYEDVVYESKRRVLQSSFVGEMNTLRRELRAIAQYSRSGQDFTEQELGEALETFVGTFPIYRSYVSPEVPKPDAQSSKYIREGFAKAKERSSVAAEVFDWLEKLLLRELGEGDARVLQFLMKLQQLTGPAMAKGLEDTTFYRYFRLVSLNEVGGDPGKFGVRVEEFHEHNLRKQERWPHAMLASATHDTKRGEDLRARVNVLSEIPKEWERTVKRWSEMNSSHRGKAGPTRNDEYLFYQTLVGGWTRESSSPEALSEFTERMEAYMLKAAKEAKLETTWTEQNAEYEKALSEFVKCALDARNENFLKDVEAFANRIGRFGYINSLVQTVLKLTAPGVPDIYQGTEFWDYSLVDPDNRRPVDFDQRKNTLEQVAGSEGALESVKSWLEHPEGGELKMLVIQRTLQFRRGHPELFEDGRYVPLRAEGAKGEHVVAFARERAGKRVVVVVPRLVAGLTSGESIPPVGKKVWSDTALSVGADAREWRSVLTGHTIQTAGGRLDLGSVLEHLPVAILAA